MSNEAVIAAIESAMFKNRILSILGEKIDALDKENRELKERLSIAESKINAASKVQEVATSQIGPMSAGDMVKKLISLGANYQSIADEIGCAGSTVKGWRYKGTTPDDQRRNALASILNKYMTKEVAP